MKEIIQRLINGVTGEIEEISIRIEDEQDKGEWPMALMNRRMHLIRRRQNYISALEAYLSTQEVRV